MPSRILKWGSLVALGILSGAGSVFAQDSAWGFPPGRSTIAPEIDHLYTVILWLTGVVFVGVEGLLLWFCIRYRRRPGGKPGYTHGNNTAEIIWTVCPAIILIFIAFYQFSTWKKAKIDFPKMTDPGVVTVQAFARQFNWNFRSPGADGAFGGDDDVIMQKRFCVPVESTVLVPLRSIDVIHSFFIFQMRVKQDTVPGHRGAVWFKPTGFYVAKIDKSAAPYNFQFQKDWHPKDYQKKWEGDFRWMFVASEADFQRDYGSKVVAIDESFQYQDGLMRPSLDSVTSTVLQNNETRKGVPWRDVDYTIVPYEGTCAELCGLNHFTMSFQMFVLPRKAYDLWMANDANNYENQTEKEQWFWQQWKN